MSTQKKYKVKLVLEISYESEINALNEDEAIDKALDNAMDFLESNTSDSQKFDRFWEYDVDYKILKIETD